MENQEKWPFNREILVDWLKKQIEIERSRFKVARSTSETRYLDGRIGAFEKALRRFEED